MKRFILPFSFALLILLVASSCQKQPRAVTIEQDLAPIFTDPQTKCQYFGYNGLTPRLDAYGRPMCPKTGETIANQVQ